MIGFTNDCTASIYVDGHYLTLAAATLASPLPTQVHSYEQCSQLIHIYIYVCMYVCMYVYACERVTWLKYSIDIKLVA